MKQEAAVNPFLQTPSQDRTVFVPRIIQEIVLSSNYNEELHPSYNTPNDMPSINQIHEETGLRERPSYYTILLSPSTLSFTPIYYLKPL